MKKSSPNMHPDKLNRLINTKTDNALSDPKVLHSNIPLSVSCNSPLSPKNSSQVRIELICTQSKELPEKFFSNKISKRDTRSSTRSHIKKLMQLNNKIIDYNELPIVARNRLTTNTQDQERIPKIIALYGIKFDDVDILKCNYKPLIPDTHKNDLLRFFIIYEEGNPNVIKIILIDPHHLVATENYEQLFYQNKHKFVYDIKDINRPIFE